MNEKSKQREFIDLMKTLGCEHVKDKTFRHKQFAFDFNFKFVNDCETIPLELWRIFYLKGYEHCQENIRHALGVE